MSTLAFSEKRLEKLSDISSDIALLILGSIVVPPLLDKFDLTAVLFGGILTLGFWSFSLWLRK